CLEAAPHFLLDPDAAIGIAAHQITTIRDGWDAVVAEAGLGEVDRNLFRRRVFLNPSIFDGAPDRLAGQ
ncbi:MAG: type II toxin-antitoxin system HipA family toxin, partial [Alphaproteobacteria bacterium]|nr:type II toxin-antitoxin system HipA family toxin [Alphaproteobacteria bacterium]